MKSERTRFWVFASGKGGVGKSVLVLHLGAALAERGRRVLLLDADLGLANLHILANVEPRGRLERVLAAAEPLDRAVTPLACGPDLLAADNGRHLCLLQGREASHGLAATLEQLKSRYDHVLVDTPRGISDAALQFCRACDLTVLVTTDEPTALTNSYAWYKIATLEDPELPVALLANRTGDLALHERFGQLCLRFLGHAPAFAGSLPEDAAVVRAVSTQRPVCGSDREAPFWRAVQSLADTLEALIPGKVSASQPAPIRGPESGPGGR